MVSIGLRAILMILSIHLNGAVLVSVHALSLSLLCLPLVLSASTAARTRRILTATAASRGGCAALLGTISTAVAGRPPSSFEWEPPLEPWG